MSGRKITPEVFNEIQRDLVVESDRNKIAKRYRVSYGTVCAVARNSTVEEYDKDRQGWKALAIQELKSADLKELSPEERFYKVRSYGTSFGNRELSEYTRLPHYEIQAIRVAPNYEAYQNHSKVIVRKRININEGIARAIREYNAKGYSPESIALETGISPYTIKRIASPDYKASSKLITESEYKQLKRGHIPNHYEIRVREALTKTNSYEEFSMLYYLGEIPKFLKNEGNSGNITNSKNIKEISTPKRTRTKEVNLPEELNLNDSAKVITDNKKDEDKPKEFTFEQRMVIWGMVLATVIVLTFCIGVLARLLKLT